MKQHQLPYGPLLLNLSILVLFFALDVRDLHYKVAWLGPDDSYRFNAVGDSAFIPTPLQRLNESVVVRPSGVGSFLQTCEALHALSRDTFFMHYMGVNCTVGSTTIPRLVLSNSVRADSIAWAACLLLVRNRRPSVCQDALVTGFYARYRMHTVKISHEWIALPESPAEAELLQLLEVIGASNSLARMTCVEAFVYDGGLGDYNATIFGCGSGTTFHSALVGYHAQFFHQLHQDKAWLTIDRLDLMGAAYTIRQNSISTLTAVSNAEFLHTTMVNYSSFGALYSLMIAIDLLLLTCHCISALQVIEMLTTSPDYLQDNTVELLSRSLYRSTPIVILTVISQLLSWMIILPNAVIWTWGGSAIGRFQAFLSTVRLWVLVLLLLNGCWDLVVACQERLAYRIVKRTFVTTFEIMLVAGLIAYGLRQSVFEIGTTKYQMETQRMVDTTTFAHAFMAYGNAFDPDWNWDRTTSETIVLFVYAPLFQILGTSLLAVIGLLMLKSLYFTVSRMRRWHPWIHKAIMPGPTLDHMTNDSQYARLPLEKVVQTAIRARSLVRNRLPLESYGDHHAFISTALVFDFGLWMQNGKLRPRRCFFNLLQPELDAHMHNETTDNSHNQ